MRRRDWLRADLAADTDRPQPIVTYYQGGARLTVTGAKVPRPAQRNVRRGKVTSFSGASRKRLFALLQGINRGRVRRLPLMVTLTYHLTWPTDGPGLKRHLDTFWKAVQRAYPKAAAVWKLELQKRGAPHYHLLVFNIPWLPAGWVARVWHRVVGDTGQHHLRAGTQVKRVKSWRGVMSYAAKYLGKMVVGGEIADIGRFWGVLNRKDIPTDPFTFPLTWRAFFRAKRALLTWEAQKEKEQRRDSITTRWNDGRGSPSWRRRRPGELQGCNVLGEPEQLVALLRCFT